MRRDSSMKEAIENRSTLTGKLSWTLNSCSVLIHFSIYIFFLSVLASDLLFQFVPPRHPVGPLGVNHVSIRTEKELQPSQEPNPKHTTLQLSLRSPESPFLLLQSQIPLPLWNKSQVILFISPPHICVILLHYCSSLRRSQVFLRLWPSRHPDWVRLQLRETVGEPSSRLLLQRKDVLDRLPFQTLKLTLSAAKW